MNNSKSFSIGLMRMGTVKFHIKTSANESVVKSIREKPFTSDLTNRQILVSTLVRKTAVGRPHSRMHTTATCIRRCTKRKLSGCTKRFSKKSESSVGMTSLKN